MNSQSLSALLAAIVTFALGKVRALEPELRARLSRETRTLRERIERIGDALAAVKG